ncbi:Fe-S cluster assembly protein SufD [Lysobacter soyae]|uniref:Fe-S cluster assembly protein SufD n=1 Tax=Lysobacter soyae TaxID=2764185 RepID=A0ABX8WQ78_9GAMM|nr:Fe-S cluster assembly protein SufD [Lysobacter sp. CJ11]QYR52584.1 Fe-S cluster assembly protein SufD [Lysobacter sp. CJ11]
MSALLESLTQPQNPLSSETRLQAIRNAGLPGRREEAWRTTALRAYERRSFAAATTPSVDAADIAHIPAPRVVFANGHYVAELSDLKGSEGQLSIAVGPGNNAYQIESSPARFLEDIVEAQNGQGLNVTVLAGKTAHLHWVNLAQSAEADVVWHAQHHVQVMEGAKLCLIEHHVGNAGASHLSNSVCTLRLDANAQCEHLRVQTLGAAMLSFTSTHASLERGAHYRRLDLEFGAALARHVLDVELRGEDAFCEAHGVAVASDKQHLDTRLNVSHIGKNARCDLRWRGIANGRSRIITHGGIRIRQGADGSDAAFNSRNILLSNTATVESQPVLEIHADEVKAAHGSTVGQLDSNALFYLRARGIPEEKARAILTRAFGNEVIDLIEDSVLAEAANAALATAMREKTL